MLEDDYQSLLALQGSPHWKRYKTLLNQKLVAKFFSILPLKDSEEILKAVGECAGINESINTIDQLCSQYKVRLEKAEKENVKTP